jgi:hypothetical protein
MPQRRPHTTNQCSNGQMDCLQCRHPELAEAAGAECLFGDPGGHVATLTLQELTASDPDCIIFAPCGECIQLLLPRCCMQWQLTDLPMCCGQCTCG